MLVELSPKAYLALCGLVRDALEVDSDATPLLNRVASELAGVTAGIPPAELADQPDTMEALHRGGFTSNQ